MTKYIFITGRVVSSLGRGLQHIFGPPAENQGLKLTIKFDPISAMIRGPWSHQHGKTHTEDGGRD